MTAAAAPLTDVQQLTLAKIKNSLLKRLALKSSTQTQIQDIPNLFDTNTESKTL